MAGDDIVVWADGTFCLGWEFSEMDFMSDDYQIIKYGTKEFLDFESDNCSYETLN